MKPLIIKYARLILITSVCILLSSCMFQKSTPFPTRDAPSIAALDLPKEGIAYPADWPEDFQYPNSFTLVEANSGTSIGGSSQGWTAMLRFDGSVDKAENALTKHYADTGWEVIGLDKQDTGEIMILLGKGESEGFTVIEPDPVDNNAALVMSTISK